MEFEWDEPKRLSNIDKHDIDLRVARAAFKDRGRIVYRSGIGHPEVRLVLVGRVAGAMVTVIHTLRDGKTRTICARTARRGERARYEREGGGG